MPEERVMELAADGPLLVFGGPYSNLQATQAVLAEAARRGIPSQRVICTGDVVAYGADAAACCDLIMASGIWVIAGNCEENLAAGALDCGCGFGHARKSPWPKRIWRGLAWKGLGFGGRIGFRVGSASAWRLPARCTSNPVSFWRMSPSQAWTPRWRRTCLACCKTSRAGMVSQCWFRCINMNWPRASRTVWYAWRMDV